MTKMSAVILAAGEGKRMKSSLSKVVHKVCGKALVDWVYAAVREAGVEETVIVVGHKANQVEACMEGKATFALQAQQLGTGHAVMQAMPLLPKSGHVIILAADTPLITGETIRAAFAFHQKNGNAATIVTVDLSDASGYGRIVRSDEGHVQCIVEHKDCNEKELQVKEINSGIYCFEVQALLVALSKLTNDNKQNEYYLTDTIGHLLADGQKVDAYKIDAKEELLGINNRVQLSEAQAIMQKRINRFHMENGVTLIDPAATYIGAEVLLGQDTVIYPNCTLEGKTIIGENCIIGANSKLVDATLANEVEVQSSVILESFVDENTHVGPFAYIRPHSHIGKAVKIGDFVEVKKSVIGDGTKISHLTYVGDADIGENVNLGCGTITVNYDGKNKFKTVIEDNVFVGCNANLVAPVRVHEGAYVAAGSTITDDVPENALAIARERQTNKLHWKKKREAE